MLDKILNINASEPYRGDRKSKNFDRSSEHQSKGKLIYKDSVSLSEIAQFLAKLDWDIRQIQYPSEDKILFNF